MTKLDFASAISPYLPAGTSNEVAGLIFDHPLSLKISRNRSTKYGDYRPPFGRQGHRISVNGDLNNYAFLITLIHEYAHYLVYLEHKMNVLPHGIEWKTTFRDQLTPFMRPNVFPVEILVPLKKHMKSPRASTSSDPVLKKALMTFDNHKKTVLEELPNESLFLLPKRGVFRRGEKKRTRYLCQHIESKKWFTVHGLAEVELINS